jgi:hypothetical protein
MLCKQLLRRPSLRIQSGTTVRLCIWNALYIRRAGMFKVSHEKQKDLLAVTDVALIVRCRVDLDDLERSKTRWKVNDNLRHRKWSETI